MFRYYKTFVIIIFLLLFACNKKTTIERAAELIEKGKYNQAIREVKKGLAKDTLNSDLHYELCQAYIGADSLSKAALVYLDLYEIDSTKAEGEELKTYLAQYCGLEPYRQSRITKTRFNEYAPYPSPGGLYYASDRRGNSNIYLLKQNRKRRIISTRDWESNPVPVSVGLCFSAGFDEQEEIYLYRFEDKKTVQLTDNETGDYPSDANYKGDKLLFLSDRDGDWDIYILDLTKGEIKAVTKNDHLDSDAIFSPDEKYVVHITKVKGEEKIVYATLKGKIKEVIPISGVRHPTFIDSHRIIFQSKDGKDWDLFVYDLKNKRSLLLTRNKRDDFRPRADMGRKEVYYVSKIGRQWDIFKIDLNSPVTTEKLIEKLYELTGKKKDIE